MRGLIVGVANEDSLAAGCAKALHDAGADIALTYLNEQARPYVEQVANKVGAQMVLPLDVTVPDQLGSVFERRNTDLHKLHASLPSAVFQARSNQSNG